MVNESSSNFIVMPRGRKESSSLNLPKELDKPARAKKGNKRIDDVLKVKRIRSTAATNVSPSSTNFCHYYQDST